jgi:GNAT superfamily N-acetyltransferase
VFEETTMDRLTPAQCAEAFQAVYKGYLMAIHVDENWFQDHVNRNCIHLNRSPLWRDSRGEPVALALLGLRSGQADRPRGWVGGFGIIPEFRGQGLAAPLIDAVLTQAEGVNAESVQLEVLVDNKPAYKTYESSGFEVRRRLVSLTCPFACRPSEKPDADLEEWNLVPPSPSKVPVAWQRELPWAVKNGGKVLLADRAWLRFRATQRKVFIYDCAFEDVDDLDNIVADLKYYHPEQSIVAVNEPPGTDLCAALASLNWVESAPQWEMHYVPE